MLTAGLLQELGKTYFLKNLRTVFTDGILSEAR